MIRFILSIIIAVPVVTFLFWFMYFMIAANFIAPSAKNKVRIDSVWQEAHEIEDNLREDILEELEVNEPPPKVEKQDIEIEDIDIVNIAQPNANIDLGLGASFSDSDIIPLVAIQPRYPRRALIKGLEGYVVVSFIITEDGTTKDVKILESTNSVFDSAAESAAEKLKYKPRVVDGQPVEIEHKYKFTFELQKKNDKR